MYQIGTFIWRIPSDILKSSKDSALGIFVSGVLPLTLNAAQIMQVVFNFARIAEVKSLGGGP